MNKLITLLSLPIVACQVGSHQAEVEARIARIENELLPAILIEGEPVLTATMGERLAHHAVPAVSIAVIDDFEIEWVRAYGLADVEEGRQATPQTLFQAASISKPVAATAALTLVQEGRLTLDGDVNQWLATWKIPSNRHTESEPFGMTLSTYEQPLPADSGDSRHSRGSV